VVCRARILRDVEAEGTAEGEGRLGGGGGGGGGVVCLGCTSAPKGGGTLGGVLERRFRGPEGRLCRHQAFFLLSPPQSFAGPSSEREVFVHIW